MSIDLGLNSLLAKTEAKIAREEGLKQAESSADALNNNDSTIKFPAVASAVPSPERVKIKNNKTDEHEESMSGVSGSLADWSFQGDASSTNDADTQQRGESPDARPQTTSTSSRDGKKGRGLHSSGGGGSGSGSGGGGGGQKMRVSQSAATLSAAPRTYAPLSSRPSLHRPSTVSALTQPLKSLGDKSLKMSPFGMRSKEYVLFSLCVCCVFLLCCVCFHLLFYFLLRSVCTHVLLPSSFSFSSSFPSLSPSLPLLSPLSSSLLLLPDTLQKQKEL